MLENATWTAVAVALPALLRFIVDQGESGIPYVTFFPAMLLGAIFLGWRYGALIALLNAVVANRLFTPDPVLFYVSVEDAVLVAYFVVTCAIVIGAGSILRSVMRDQDTARREDDAAEREQTRRSRSLLTTIQSLAHITARHSGPDDFAEAFDKRIWALGKVGELNRNGDLEPCRIDDLVAAIVAPLRNEDNFVLDGPDCPVSPDACLPLAMALHELGSNAAKYGALSVSGGRVLLSWSPKPEHRAIELKWKEEGGPPVPPEPMPGGGSALLLRAQYGLRDVKLRYEPGGVECEMLVDGAPQA